VRKVVAFVATGPVLPAPHVELALNMGAQANRFVAIDARLANVLQAAATAAGYKTLTGLVNDAFATFVETKLRGCTIDYAGGATE
jgi:hypothetical protein